MARGKLRIRQRGSRQQWAQARNFKAFGGDELAAAPSAAAVPDRPLSGQEVAQSLRCGLCGVVAEQTLRDGRALVRVPYAHCISCDEVRCEGCWASSDDECVDGDEHEFLEVRYQRDGAAQSAAFADWRGA
jgi:hypothetical protein